MFEPIIYLNDAITWANSYNAVSRHGTGVDNKYGGNNHCVWTNDHNIRANIHVIEAVILYTENHDVFSHTYDRLAKLIIYIASQWVNTYYTQTVGYPAAGYP